MHLSFKLFFAHLMLLLVAICINVAIPNAYAQTLYQDIEWDELIPASWHPEHLFEGINIDDYEDDAPQVAGLLEKMTEAWKNAPANPAMDGKAVRIPGFVVPLEWYEQGGLQTFLLVPYFGACIHVPPPPANQIIYVESSTPLKDIHAMDTVWVNGILSIMQNDSGDMGTSGYALALHKLEPYL